MSRITRHFNLPKISPEMEFEVKFYNEGRSATLFLDYFIDGVAKRSGIIFDDAIITETGSERFPNSHGVSAFDKLTEIHQSPWVAQIKEKNKQDGKELDHFRHFFIYVWSVGSFNVIAKEFRILPEESGSWGSLQVTTTS